MKNTSSFSSLLAREARESGNPRYFAKTTHRLASFAFFLVFAASALWSGDAQAQIVFRETFGAANDTLPTAQSTADGNWLNRATCLNGQVVSNGGDSASDGAASTHYLFHNTAACAYTAGQAVWRTVSAIAVQPNTSYVYIYYTMVSNQVSDPVLTQVVTPDAGAITVVSTTNTAYPATNNTWVRRQVIFTTSATTTSVNLRINNNNTTASGNDFGIDDVMLATMPTITLTKTTQNGAGGPFGFTLTNTRRTTGTVTTTAAGTATVVDGDTNAAVTDFTVTTLGTAVTIEESTLPALWNFTSASCTNAAGATVGTLSGREITIPAGAVVAGQRFTCSYVNSTPPSFGTCSSNMYLGVGDPTQLHRIDTSNNPLTYPPIGSPYTPTYNAMGYDPASNYLFATRWDDTTSTYRLLRIAANGAVQDTGAITGGGIIAGPGIASGEVGADGFYYIKPNGATNQMWRVNLATRSAASILLSKPISSGDLAWSNGLLYAQDHDTGIFHSIDPALGTVTDIGPSGFIGGADAFGSMIGASNGVFGRRNSGGFYKFDLTTGAATLISDAPAGGGDGAKCATTAVNFAADLAITKTDGSTTYTPGNNVVYTIVVSNNGPFGVQNAQVVDALPTGVTSATWTCGSATAGGVCGAASGSGAINTTANLPAGASVTYTLTMFVPSTFSGNLTNTATVTAPVGTTESNTNNNSATDTDTQFPLPAANIANISCSADPNLFNTAYNGAGGRMASGADTYWQAAVTGPDQTSVPAGLSYSTAQVINPLPAHFSPSPYATANWIAQDSTGFQGPTTQRNDYFFRYQFNLGPGVDPAAFQLAMNFMADNAVENVYVNGTPSNVRSNYGADAYAHDGFTTANAGSGTLAGAWQSGLNEIVVHVKSQGEYVGFVAQNTPQPLCAPATVTLNKTTRLVTGGPFGFGLTNTAQATGSVSTVAIDTPAQVDGDTSSAGTAEPFAVTTFGTDVVITENTLPAGWLLSDAVCTSGGTPIGSRSDSAYTIPGSLIDASAESFVCTFTNTPTTNLRIDKTANPTTLRTGETVTYAITVNNDGPGPGDGAVMADPAVAGVDCTTATLTCSASGGAACPASLDVATLQSTGLVIPTFPAGGALQFGMACTVTATGQ